ncbi:MAG: hypothetical protein IT516_12355 [Burkholderiales bacterium]|nr:hypothetical protein [Burkholderiales bacterium]
MKLFYDDEFEAIREAIASSDHEFKEVACHLWPSRKPESAYARLKACLNETKDERLTFGEIVEICRFCDRYDPLYFMCDQVSHDRPKPIAKEDELARLLREYLAARMATERLGPQIERLRTA